MYRLLLLVLLSGLALFASPPALADAPRQIRIETSMLEALRGALPGDEHRVLLQWDAGDGEAANASTPSLEVRLRRIEVYAADARVLEATADGYRELPLDPRLHFVAEPSAGQRMSLSVDAETGRSVGLLLDAGRMYELSGAMGADALVLDALDMDLPLPDGSSTEASCSGDMGSVSDALGKTQPIESKPLAARDAPAGLHAPLSARGTLAARSFAPKAATRQVTLAIDTDNELLQKKFSNNTTAATAYVAELVAALNAIYEDDPAQYGLQLRLLQGTLILRPSTTPDPYNNTDSSATGAALNEFGAWWRDNQTGVPRAFALKLSGKASNQNSSSGIAWLVTSGTYCTATGSTGSSVFGHYSVNRVFWNPSFNGSRDAYLVGHELGHNLGARHTHCANASTGAQASTGTIDRCWNGESGSGCYAGTQACPSGAESPLAPQGTLMSYCHLNGLGCGVSTELHPTHVSQLNARLASQPSSCVGPISTNQAPTLTAPTSLSGTEDTPLTLSGISVADPDSASLVLTFSVPGGSVNASSGGGVSVGGSAGARTLTGSPSALNTYLSGGGVVYAPAANANGNVTLGINASDGTANASRSVTLAIAAVNDAPTLTLPATISLNEDQSVQVRPITFADVDAGSGALLATFSVGSGSLVASSGSGVTVGGTASTRTLAGTLANLNAFIAAGSLSYAPAANANGSVPLNVTINDQGNSPAPAQQAQGSLNLQIAAVNDPPSLVAPASLSAQAGVATAINGVSYADPDSPSGGINVQVSYAASIGSFSATAAGGVSVSGSGTGNLTLSGLLSAINAFVGSTPVRYTASASGPASVSLNLSINDLGNIGSGGALTATRTIVTSVSGLDTDLFRNGFEP